MALALVAAGCSSTNSRSEDLPVPLADSGIEAEAGGHQEVCNFADDDGDGLVDEGFAWVAEPGRSLFVTTRYATVFSATPLPDGDTAVVGADNFGAPGDQIFVAIVSQAGQLVRGPAFLPIDGSVNGGGISVMPSGDLAVIHGSTDWAQCKNGCPTHVVTLGADDLGIRTDVLLQSEDKIQNPRQLACSGGSCVAAMWKYDGKQFGMVWFDPMSGKVTRTMPWPGEGSRGEFVAADVIAWMAISEFGDPLQSRVHMGILSLAGDELSPGRVVLEGGTMIPANVGAIAKLNDSVLLSWTRTGDGGVAAESLIVGLDGTVRAGPAQPFSQAPAASGVGVSTAPVVGTPINLADTNIWRLGPDLALLGVPNNPMTLPRYWSGVYAPVDEGLLLFSSTYDGRTVDVTRVRCFGVKP